MIFGRKREAPKGWETLSRSDRSGSVTVGRGGGRCVHSRPLTTPSGPWRWAQGLGEGGLEWEAVGAPEARATPRHPTPSPSHPGLVPPGVGDERGGLVPGDKARLGDAV